MSLSKINKFNEDFSNKDEKRAELGKKGQAKRLRRTDKKVKTTEGSRKHGRITNEVA
jgi:hypothetical protein